MSRWIPLSLLAAALVLAAPAGAEDAALDRIAAAAPGPDAFPDADAVILSETHTVVLDADGRRTDRFRRLVKVFTPHGRSLFSEGRFPFDGARQTFKVLRARTRMADGTVVETPERGINVVAPRDAADAPPWPSLREGVVSLLGLEDGAILELEVEIADRAGGRAGADGVELFGAAVPVLEKTLVVTAPDGAALRSDATGPGWSAPDRGRADPKGRWTRTGIPAFSPEPGAPPLSELCPRVAWSTRGSWESWGRGFADAFSAAASAELPADLRAALEEIGRTRTSTGEKAAAVEALLARRVRLVELGLERCEDPSRPAAATWAEGLGRAQDRAALLCACFQALDIEACPVWTARDRAPLAPAVCAPSALGALWLAARGGGREWWVSATGGSRETAFAAPAGLWRFDAGRAPVPVAGRDAAPEDRSAAVTGTMRLSPDGAAEGVFTAELRGALNPCFRRWAGEGEARDIVADAFRAAFGAGEVAQAVEVRVAPEGSVVTVTLRFSSVARRVGDRLFWVLPAFVFLPSLDVPSSDRRRPFRFPGAMAETLDLRIVPPAGWTAEALPAALSGEIGGALRLATLSSDMEDAVRVFRSLTLFGQDARDGAARDLVARFGGEGTRTVVFAARR